MVENHLGAMVEDEGADVANEVEVCIGCGIEMTKMK